VSCGVSCRHPVAEEEEEEEEEEVLDEWMLGSW
jgi:hypothetical protein